MIRRDVLRLAGGAAVGAATATRTDAQDEGAAPGSGPYATPWRVPDPEAPGRQNLVAPPEDAFIPGRFAGKTVLVTGCARGMGRGAAIRLAREGANVVGIDWLEEQGNEVIESLGAEGFPATFVPGDIGDDATCTRMVEVAVATYGGVDAALNNAGVMDGVFSGEAPNYDSQKDLLFAQIHEASEAYWDNVFRTNATGVFLSMRAELRQMVAQGRGGAIVNVGSIAGLTGLAGNPAYVASKHAVNGLTKNAAVDYAPYGIRVNSVNMAATDTPMIARAGALVAAQSAARPGPTMGRIKTQSLLAFTDEAHRSSTVSEQVTVMLFLLSPESSNLTGATFATDGGWTAY